MRAYHDVLRKLRIYLRRTEKETSKNNFVAEYMINKRSIHVLMHVSKKFMRCILNQSFSCCLAISVDVIVLVFSSSLNDFLRH